MSRAAIRWFDELQSTSSTLIADAATLPHGTVYAAHSQTAGRGQRGNSWEAAAGMNLSFSVLLRPRNIPASQAFAISMVTAMSIADALQQAMGGREVRIKWPNDIYVDDLKLCGILIENSFSSGIDRSVVGIGINVNQTKFVSDAPNPVSMAQLTDSTYDIQSLLIDITDRILADFDRYDSAPDIASLTARYRSRQWRGTGVYPWRDNICGEVVNAAIASIAPDGMLTLATDPPRTFAFKEISAVL